MKNTINLLATAVLLAACGASAPTDDIGRKRAELDSLETLYKEIGEQIKAADSWITEHDVQRSIRLTPAQWAKFDAAGGIEWLWGLIQRARPPAG